MVIIAAVKLSGFFLMLRLVKSLTRKQKRNVLLILDLLLVPVALVFTFAVQADPRTPLETLTLLLPALPYLMAVAAGVSTFGAAFLVTNGVRHLGSNE